MGRIRHRKQDAILKRRLWVSRLRARKLTEPQIVQALAALEDPIVVSLATVCDDIKMLRAEWAEKTRWTTEQWITEELADLDQIEASAWSENKLDLVLRTKEHRSKMLGLIKPEETKHTGEVTLKVLYGERTRNTPPESA